MEVTESSVLNACEDIIKGKCNGGKKRRFESDKVSPVSKKKKTEKNVNFKRRNEKFIQYKQTSDYVKVVAKPELLPPTPIFFKKGQQKNNKKNFSNPFFSDFVTIKCFNTDWNARFSSTDINMASNEDDEVNGESQVEDISFCSSDEKPSDRKKEKKLPVENNISDDNPGRSDTIKEVEKVISYADIYEVVQGKGMIFHLHHPCTFSFQGEINVTLISGEIEVMGFTLKHSLGSIEADIYSPNHCIPLTIESKFHDQSKSSAEIKNSLLNLLTEKDIDKLLSKINPSDSILFIEPLSSNFGAVLNKYSDKTLFSKDVEDFSTVSKSFKRLQSIFNFNLSKNSKVFRKNHMWDKIPLRHCTILCGGNGVGKSTLLRYFINKLVANQEKVLCLDFDPGQSEFTHPGCLSAVVVDKPVLGPNFTHVKHPHVMVYFGEVEVSKCPAKYLDCVNYIIKTCSESKDLSEMKWCVNTMGFCKGLGIELMVSILKLLKPDTVVQIKSVDQKRNYPFYLTMNKVNSKRGFKLTENPHLFFDLCVVNSYAEQGRKPIQSGLKSKKLRELMSLSYFSQMVSSPYHNFNAVQPYLISFCKIYLGVDSLISPNDILKAFNGSIVSLSCFEPGCEKILSPESEEENFFKIVEKPSISPCLALGIVRGIDCIEKKLYVITHLSSEEMAKVNCLSLGRISPPNSMFLKQDFIEGQKVYTTVGTEGAIQGVKRIFRVPIS